VTVQRFPLQWPAGWKRTPRHQQRRARFGARSHATGWSKQRALTIGDALGRVSGELRRLGVLDGDWLVSSDLRVRLDGLPYSNQAEPADRGVAVYFRLNRQDRVLACDTWDRIADNLAAIAAHIECLRGIDRYGVGSLDQAFTGYTALPPKGTTWRTTLGFAPDQAVTRAEVEAAFRAHARHVHPDVEGGSHDAMTSLTEARAEALAELEAR
jgi:hypothetical protein